MDEFNVLDKILLKSHPEDRFLSQLAEHNKKYMYFPIIKDLQQIVPIINYPGINLVGFELIAESKDSELFDRELNKNLKNQGYFVFANAEKLDEYHNLCAGFDDDKSLIEGFDKGWGVLLDMGFNVIQTDWTHLLSTFRDERKNYD